MKHYALGFAFQTFMGLSGVWLIEKRRPAWQAGRMNGIGGHVERGELPARAMAREFMEEACHLTQAADWREVITLRGDEFLMDVYTLELEPDVILKSGTDEELRFVPFGQLNNFILVPNLLWMIPLCLDSDRPCGTLTQFSKTGLGQTTSPT